MVTWQPLLLQPRRVRAAAGFTLIELMVVMAIVALLASLAAPRYFTSVERSKERVLMQNLNLLRDAIDKYQADTGAYPATLAELSAKRYVRRVPEDPLTGSDDTWVVVAPPGPALSGAVSTGAPASGVYDIRSGAPGTALDGTPYASW